MAKNSIPLTSELPGPQMASGPQTGGGAQGLLDVLGALGSGIGKVLQTVPEIAAYRQAALGNPEQLKMLQEQRRQQNLLNQLQTMSQQEMSGPFGETLKRQLQFGDVTGAQKTLSNLPKYKELQTALQNPKLGLAPETQYAISSLTAINPELGAKALQQNLYQTEVGKRRAQELEKTFQQRTALEEKKMARLEKKIPGNILANALENQSVAPDDIAGMVGLLQGAGVKLPANENEAKLFVSRILSSPQVKKFIPAKEEKSFTKKVLDFFSGNKSEPAAAPAQAPAQGFQIKRIE